MTATRDRLADESPHHIERSRPHGENPEKRPLKQNPSDYPTSRRGQTGRVRRGAFRRHQSGSGDRHEQGQREDVEKPADQTSGNRARAEQESQSGAKGDNSDHDHQGKVTHR